MTINGLIPIKPFNKIHDVNIIVHYSLIVFGVMTNAIKYCINMGLPRSWWEDSVRHIQFPIVEHNSQFKAFPVSVSPAFILSSLILLFSASAFPFETR